jgi:hypothetical protein
MFHFPTEYDWQEMQLVRGKEEVQRRILERNLTVEEKREWGGGSRNNFWITFVRRKELAFTCSYEIFINAGYLADGQLI